MAKEDINGESGQQWFIDLSWHEPNSRSFSALAQGCLCPRCRGRLGGEVSAAKLLKAIGGCCSKAPDFITDRLPVLESVFRLFLANGNQPLGLDELGDELAERRGGYRTPGVTLSRLLASDQHYGLRPVA